MASQRLPVQVTCLAIPQKGTAASITGGEGSPPRLSSGSLRSGEGRRPVNGGLERDEPSNRDGAPPSTPSSPPFHPCHATGAARRTQRPAAQQVHSCRRCHGGYCHAGGTHPPPHPPPLASGTARPTPGIAFPYRSNGTSAGEGPRRHLECDASSRMSGRRQPGREEAACWHGWSPSP